VRDMIERACSLDRKGYETSLIYKKNSGEFTLGTGLASSVIILEGKLDKNIHAKFLLMEGADRYR
jgi:hypothetical protein